MRARGRKPLIAPPPSVAVETAGHPPSFLRGSRMALMFTWREISSERDMLGYRALEVVLIFSRANRLRVRHSKYADLADLIVDTCVDSKS